MANIEEENYFETDSKYGRGIAIDQWKNEYSIVSAVKRNDTIYKEWVYPVKRNDAGESVAGEKMFPMKISLGTRGMAIVMLKRLLNVLEGTEPPTREPGDDDIAF